jgi:biotin carboxyl carrier protein
MKGGAAAILALFASSCVAEPPAAKAVDQAGIPAPQSAVSTPATPPQTSHVGPFRFDAAPQQGGLIRGQVPANTTRLMLNGAPVVFGPDKRFVIGFGRDAPSEATLVATGPGMATLTERLIVARRQWRIENLPTLPRFSQPAPEFLARRKGELAQINAARRINAQSDGWQQVFRWPARGRISGVFGSQRIYRGEPGAPHNGVDVAASTGTAIVAPADGVVILAAAAPFTLEGNLLMIDHGMGLNSAFLHLSRIDVKAGDRVRQGQALGAIGMTGRATGPHLHWSLRWQDERIDPAVVAGAMR